VHMSIISVRCLVVCYLTRDTSKSAHFAAAPGFDSEAVLDQDALAERVVGYEHASWLDKAEWQSLE